MKEKETKSCFCEKKEKGGGGGEGECEGQNIGEKGRWGKDVPRIKEMFKRNI